MISVTQGHKSDNRTTKTGNNTLPHLTRQISAFTNILAHGPRTLVLNKDLQTGDTNQKREIKVDESNHRYQQNSESGLTGTTDRINVNAGDNDVSYISFIYESIKRKLLNTRNSVQQALLEIDKDDISPVDENPTIDDFKTIDATSSLIYSLGTTTTIITPEDTAAAINYKDKVLSSDSEKRIPIENGSHQTTAHVGFLIFLSIILTLV